MNILIVTFTILGVFSTNNHLQASSGHGRGQHRSSISGSRKSHSDSRDWTQSDMEMWESFGRWRREHGRDWDRRRDKADRWTGDSRRNDRDRDRSGRDRDNNRDTGRDNGRSDRNRPDYPQPEIPVVEQPPPNPRIPFPPLPIIIEPIRPPVAPVMPSIIEPYPEIETTVYSSSVDYYESPTGHKTSVIPSITASYDTFSSNYGSVSSILTTSYAKVPTSAPYASKTVAAPIPRHNSTAYDFTVIMTTPESTVTTSVTGRYRAMSNSATTIKSNSWAGPISFALVLFSSILIIAIV